MTLNDRRDELRRMAERSCLEAHTHGAMEPWEKLAD
jgi:hypothetical protein